MGLLYIPRHRLFEWSCNSMTPKGGRMWHTTRVGRSLAVMLRAFYGLLLVAIAHPRPSADHHYLRRRRRRAGKTGRSHRGGPMGEHLDYPTGVALDRAGNVFVGDSGNARVVRRVDRDTGVITTVAGPHPIRLDAGRKHHTLASEAPFQERVTLFQWLHTKSLPTRHAPVGYD